MSDPKQSDWFIFVIFEEFTGYASASYPIVEYTCQEFDSDGLQYSVTIERFGQRNLSLVTLDAVPKTVTEASVCQLILSLLVDKDIPILTPAS